ncbi:MAG TPA: NAD-dependent epimerase/dehydratase family protein [Candidatus Saccharimonadales bacterium]|nr:NAD-dependent epimerase/dehydratase family protein [Candidatus Saccharimonadales bacterium]
MPKIAIIGANGFIGRHLVTRLAAVPDNDIVAFDRFSGQDEGGLHPFAAYQNITVVRGDFFDKGSLEEAIAGAEYVFHLISTTTPATANDNPFIDIETNVRGSLTLFDFCVKHHVKKVIFISSGGAVYGGIDSDKASEDTPPEPRSPYGIGKLTIEHFLRYFKYTSGLDYVAYRVGNPYGPGQNIYGKQGVIPIFMRHFLEQEPITVYGDGSMTRDYIYIDDLIDMLAGSYAAANAQAEYNVGSGQGASVNQLIELIGACAGHQAKKEFLPTPATFIQNSVLAIDRFTNEFNIRPTTSLTDGIAKTWDYVKDLK